MKKLVVSALALTALAGAANAQLDPTRFGIEVNPVIRTYTDNGDGTFTADDVGTSHTVDTRSGTGGAQKVRIELRYRITVTGSTTGSYTAGGSTFSSGGLASTSVNVNLSSQLSPGAMLLTSPIGSNNNNSGTGFIASDSTIDPGSGYGMYAPWRTGVIPPDQTFAGNNGILIGNTIDNILPLATSAPDQRSGTTAANAARSWSFYAFDVMLPENYQTDATGQQVINFQVVRGVSNGTPAPFLFFPRVGASNASSAIEGSPTQFSTGAVSLTILGAPIPAPASAVLLGVGGLVAARRRRN